ncbi:MAG: hypothetical protein AAFQ58_09470 [Pseudomonadota bacterium]
MKVSFPRLAVTKHPYRAVTTLGVSALLGVISAMQAQAECFSTSNPKLPNDELIAPTLTNGEDGWAIVQAVRSGNLDDVETLVRGQPDLLSTRTILPEGVRPSNGNMADILTIAVANCDPLMVGALLELGAAPNGAIPGLALTYAALADDLVMAVVLLQGGADPDAKTKGRTTVLRELLFYKRSDAVALLAQAGADVNRAEMFGRTPLDAALSFGDWNSAKALMDAGANPWQVSHKGVLPAFRLMNASVQGGQDRSIRNELLERVEAGAPIWPPPPPADVIQNVKDGLWPSAAMRQAGFTLTDGAVRSIEMISP